MERDLLAAIRAGDLPATQRLLKEGVDIDFATSNGTTPLIAAAESGRLEIVSLLLELGADPSAKDKDGLTPLALAADQGRSDIVELLLKRGASFPQRQEAAAPSEQRGDPALDEVRYEEGPILVIEHRGPLYVNNASIVVENKEKKALAKGLLAAAFPEQMADGMRRLPGGMVRFSFSLKSLELKVVTLAEHVAQLKYIDDGIPERRLAGLPPFDAEKTRAEIAELLKSHFAVVYRYVEDHTVR